MGQFAHWVVVRGPATAIRAIGLEPTDESIAPGWRYGAGEGLPDDLDTLVADLVGRTGSPALGAWVEDSDIAYLVAVAPDGAAARLAFGAELAPERGLPPTTPESVAAFAEWSRANAPTEIPPAKLQALLDRDRAFAEEGVFELLAELGLEPEFDERRPAHLEKPAPSLEELGAAELGGYTAPLPLMWATHRLGDDVSRPWRELRYVTGLGEGYIGVWDREAPTTALERYPRSRRGQYDAVERLNELLMPLVLREHRLDELGGFERTVPGYDHVMPAYRRIAVRDARFVVGRGAGFVGVWDREHPDEAIERFGNSDNGALDACARAATLLLDVLAAGVRVGTDREYAVFKGSGFAFAYLVVDETPHPTWRPISPAEGGTLSLYTVDDRRVTYSGGGSRARVRHFAVVSLHGAAPPPEWSRVPDDVQPTLAESLRWVRGQI